MKEEEKKKDLEEKAQERWGCNTINPKYCMTCMFAHGEPPFADLPRKAYCEMYPKEEGQSKPEAVYYDGAKCEFYEKEN